MGAPVPKNEAERLAALAAYQILDTPAEEPFDRITRLTARILGVPIAVISLVDEHRQWFKSRRGVRATETPRDIAFCAHAILSDDVLVVPDALADPRFSRSPLVRKSPKIRFYAGAPLLTPDGFRLGALCAIDRCARQFARDQTAVLADLASIVIDEMELRRLAAIDPLTGAFNRRMLMQVGEQEFKRSRRYDYPLSLIMMDLDCFKHVNDRYGHAAGDDVLRAVSAFWRREVRAHDVLGRYGGEEFVIVLPHADEVGARIVADRLREGTASLSVPSDAGMIDVTVSIGVTASTAGDTAFESALKRADRALYDAKAAGRNRVVLKQAA